jgi:hypothetical protein
MMMVLSNVMVHMHTHIHTIHTHIQTLIDGDSSELDVFVFKHHHDRHISLPSFNNNASHALIILGPCLYRI